MPAFVLAELCRGCQSCVRVCPQGAIVMKGNLAIVNPSTCMDCEECYQTCMQGAITTVISVEGFTTCK